MSAVVIISIFLLVLASIAILRSKRSSSINFTHEFLPPIKPRGLFGAEVGSQSGDGPLKPVTVGSRSESITKFIERARHSDLEVLADAHALGDRELYREVLDTIVRQPGNGPEIIEQLSRMIGGGAELRSSPLLVEKALESWEATPARSSVGSLLRLAALSDDADTFLRPSMPFTESGMTMSFH